MKKLRWVRFACLLVGCAASQPELTNHSHLLVGVGQRLPQNHWIASWWEREPVKPSPPTRPATDSGAAERSSSTLLPALELYMYHLESARYDTSQGRCESAKEHVKQALEIIKWAPYGGGSPFGHSHDEAAKVLLAALNEVAR